MACWNDTRLLNRLVGYSEFTLRSEIAGLGSLLIMLHNAPTDAP
jgi:hypothetical protein